MRLNTLTLSKVSDASVSMMQNVSAVHSSSNKQLNFEFLLSYGIIPCDFLCLFADAEQKNLFIRLVVT